MNELVEEFVEKLASLEKEISREKGSFDLFAVFLREDVPDRWDVVVSAKWLERDEKDGLEYLVEKFKSVLTADEIKRISRIVLLDRQNPGVKKITSEFRVRHKPSLIEKQRFFESVDIERGYVITSGLSR